MGGQPQFCLMNFLNRTVPTPNGRTTNSINGYHKPPFTKHLKIYNLITKLPNPLKIKSTRSFKIPFSQGSVSSILTGGTISPKVELLPGLLFDPASPWGTIFFQLVIADLV